VKHLQFDSFDFMIHIHDLHSAIYTVIGMRWIGQLSEARGRRRCRLWP
jgi:hypothetical protein